MNFFKKKFWFSKAVAAITIVVLVFSSFAFVAYPKKAEAVVPTACFFPLDFNCLKEGALDLAFKVLVRTIIRGLTNSIISWIQGDDGRNVGFVGNFEQEFRRQIDIRGGEFLNQISGINMCGDIGAFLQISLRTSSSAYKEQFACTVTDIVDNVDNFFSDFTQGGWPAFIRITHDHQNNPYGAFLFAYDAKIQAEGAAATALERTLLANNGFKGVQKAVDAKCEGDDEGSLRCQTEYLIKTPGKLVYDLLNHGVLTDARALEVADEIDEAVQTIASALISKLIGSVTDGIFNPELADIPANEEDVEDTLVINAPSRLPEGQVGIPYAFTLNAANGVSPYRWRITNGSLSPGITLSEGGLISGTPTTEGTYGALIEVTDRVRDTDLKQFTIEIKRSATSTPP